MGNKPTFPLDTPLGCLLAHCQGYQLDGLKRKNSSNIVLGTGLPTPWEVGKNGPGQSHLNLPAFCSSVYTANMRVNTRRFPMPRPLWPSTRILSKGEKVSSETPINALSKSSWHGPRWKTPHDLLLTPSVLTEYSGKGSSGSPRSWDLREGHLQPPQLRLFPSWDYDQEVSFTLHRRQGHPCTKKKKLSLKKGSRWGRGKPHEFMFPFL